MHAVVVGAGPAGCVSAAVLAKRGWRVSVFEQRSIPAEIHDPALLHRTYPLVLSGR